MIMKILQLKKKLKKLNIVKNLRKTRIIFFSLSWTIKISQITLKLKLTIQNKFNWMPFPMLYVCKVQTTNASVAFSQDTIIVLIIGIYK